MESLLPYLLAYPNADDPLNREASVLLRDNPSLYTAKVLENVKRHGLKNE
jgi:ubiquitin-protein ligase